MYDDYDTRKSEQYRFRPKTSDVSCCFSTQRAEFRHGRQDCRDIKKQPLGRSFIEVPNQNDKDISKYNISRPNKTQNKVNIIYNT